MYLVTGSGGFIGRRLLKFLKQTNKPIRLVSKNKGFNTGSNINLQYITCDFERESIEEGVFDGVKFVFHLAGISESSTCLKDQFIYEKVNVKATLDLALGALKNGVQHFIFISSTKAAEYFVNDRGDIEPLTPANFDLYSKSKKEAELGLLRLAKSTACPMKITIVRPALVYGPDVKGNLRHMFNLVGRNFFPPLPRVNNCKSMIHVDDLARFLIFLTLENLNQPSGKIFIATDGNDYSTREIYESMCVAINKKVPLWSVPFIIFKILKVLHPNFKRSFDKLFGNDCYSSSEINKIGFVPKFNIWDKKSWI